MGARANYVIKDAEGWKLYYSHWGADSIAEDLFWGPAHAVEFIRAQRERAPDCWLDDSWAEGGALVDFTTKTLLVFGDASVDWRIDLRRAWLALASVVWSGWKLRWCIEELGDFADHLGLDCALVRSGKKLIEEARTVEEIFDPAFDIAHDSRMIVSVRKHDGALALYCSANGEGETILAMGPSFLAMLETQPALPEYRCPEFPDEGIHIDLAASRIDWWSGWERQDLPAVARSAWPDWEVVWNRDCFETQLSLTRGALSFPPMPSWAESVREMSAGIAVRGRDASAQASSLVQKLEAQGNAIALNSSFFEHKPVVPGGDWTKVLSAAVAQVLRALEPNQEDR